MKKQTDTKKSTSTQHEHKQINTARSNDTTGINPKYWKSQLYVSLWALAYLGIAIVSVLLTMIGLDPQMLLLPFFAITILPLVVGVILAHFGFILDGRAVKKHKPYNWNPWWWAYFLCSWLTISVLVSPIYLFKRRRATGRPNKTDVYRKLSIRGIFIPWY